MKKFKLSFAVAAVLLATAGAFATTSNDNEPTCDTRPISVQCPTELEIDCCFDGNTMVQKGPHQPL